MRSIVMNRLTGLLARPRRWLRRLYDWTLHWSDTPHAMTVLFLVAVAESSVFPIPPDALLIAIVAANGSRWLAAAAITTLGSVIGGMLGYAIGYGFMATLGRGIIEFYRAEAHWERVVVLYNDVWGVWFLAAAAFTPIPYKVATIAAGATGMAFWPFVLVSFFGRAGRFALVAGTLRLFGPPIRRMIEQHFDLAAALFFVLLLGGFVALRYL